MQPDDFPKNDESSPLGLRVGTGATGLEPATSGVTGRRANQVRHAPVSRAAWSRSTLSRDSRLISSTLSRSTSVARVMPWATWPVTA